MIIRRHRTGVWKSVDEASASAVAVNGVAAIRRRLISGLGAQSFVQLLRVAIQFVTVPLFIHAWGSELFQDWIVISAVTGFLAVLDLGTQTYFGNQLMYFWSRGASQEFLHTLRIALGSYLVISLSAVFILGPIAIAVDWHAVLGLHAVSQNTMNWALFVLAIATMPRLFISFLLTVYSARGELDRGQNVFSLYLVGQNTAIALALVLRESVGTVAFICLLSDTLMVLGIVLDQSRRYRGIRFAPRLPTRSELRGIISKSPFYLVGPVSAAALLQGPVLILSALGSAPGVVITFTTTQILAGLARQPPYQLALGMGIEMSRHNARQDLHTLLQLYMNSGRFICAVIGLLSGMLLVTAGPFAHIWTHGQVPFDNTLLMLLIAATWCVGPAQSALSLLTYTNHPRPVALALAAYTIFGLSLCAALVPHFSAEGAAGALWLSEFAAVGTLSSLRRKQGNGLAIAAIFASKLRGRRVVVCVQLCGRRPIGRVVRYPQTGRPCRAGRGMVRGCCRHAGTATPVAAPVEAFAAPAPASPWSFQSSAGIGRRDAPVKRRAAATTHPWGTAYSDKNPWRERGLSEEQIPFILRQADGGHGPRRQSTRDASGASASVTIRPSAVQARLWRRGRSYRSVTSASRPSAASRPRSYVSITSSGDPSGALPSRRLPPEAWRCSRLGARQEPLRRCRTPCSKNLKPPPKREVADHVWAACQVGIRRARRAARQVDLPFEAGAMSGGNPGITQS